MGICSTQCLVCGGAYMFVTHTTSSLARQLPEEGRDTVKQKRTGAFAAYTIQSMQGTQLDLA
eukprot:1157965-Pelagomonas_calceolata.AAC.11